jgi:hypothetical protein
MWLTSKHECWKGNLSFILISSKTLYVSSNLCLNCCVWISTFEVSLLYLTRVQCFFETLIGCMHLCRKTITKKVNIMIIAIYNNELLNQYRNFCKFVCGIGIISSTWFSKNVFGLDMIIWYVPSTSLNCFYFSFYKDCILLLHISG